MTPLLLLLLAIASSSIVTQAYVIKPKSNAVIKPKSKVNAANTNRDDISDKEFKEIFRLGKTKDDSKNSVVVKDAKSSLTSGKRWGEILAPDYLYAPVGINNAAVGWTIATQTLLINMSFLAGYFLDSRLTTLTKLSFDPSSLSLGLLFGLGMAIVGAIADTLPIFKNITRDTRMYTLRLLGRDTNQISALATALLLSMGAGIAEEAFFRGFVFNVANWALGIPGAFIISSSLFALGHYPLWGANAFLEAFLGGIFCYCYYYSGFNLIVPIVAHATYDLITIFSTWRSASNEMKTKMSQAIKATGTDAQVSELGSYSTDQIERAITKALFDVLDLDADGSINAKELRVGLRLFGFGNPLFETGSMSQTVDQIFKDMDTNKDGKISFKEFSEALKKEGVFGQSNATAQGKKA